MTTDSEHSSRKNDQSRLVNICIISYIVGALITYPQALNITDEFYYINTAKNCVESFCQPKDYLLLSPYLPGTSILIVPLFLLLGWKGSFLLGIASLSLSTHLMKVWLRRQNLPEIGAILLLFYIPAFALGRHAMSDLPSLLFCLIFYFLIWDLDQSKRRLFWAGLFGGLSLLFRETNIIVIAPFLAGALLKSGKHRFPLLLGFSYGVLVRLIACFALFGTPLYVNRGVTPFDFSSAHIRVLQYLIAISVLIPGGVIAIAQYKGNKWKEILAAVCGIIGLYSAYSYDAEASGLLRQTVLGPRYLMPIVPLIIISLSSYFHIYMERLARWKIWSILLPILCLSGHIAINHFEKEDLLMLTEIRRQLPTTVSIASNFSNSLKYVNPIFGFQKISALEWLRPEYPLPPGFTDYIVVVDRSETNMRTALKDQNIYLLEKIGIESKYDSITDKQLSKHRRLRIWKLKEKDEKNLDNPLVTP